MGIEQLLNFVKPAIKKIHICQFENKVAAIDAMSWLYRGCYNCTFELNQQIDTKTYLYYLQKMISLLKCFNIKPILVFDGRQLPSKQLTEQARKRQKQKNKEKGEEFLQAGNEQEARKYFQRCIKITKKIKYQTIDVLRKLNINIIIAPYEADAQVSYLVREKIADFAITEDSDLICYNCPKIIFKLSSNGECEYLELQKLCEEKEQRQQLASLHLKKFFAMNLQSRIESCVMAGCDYLPSIKGIGIKKSVDFIDKYGKVSSAVKHLRTQKQFMGIIPQDYDISVEQISKIFYYQRVFDPRTKQLQPYNILPEDFSEQDEKLIGEKFENIEQFTQGLLDFKTLQLRPIEDIDFKTLFRIQSKKFDDEISGSLKQKSYDYIYDQSQLEQNDKSKIGGNTNNQLETNLINQINNSNIQQKSPLKDNNDYNNLDIETLVNPNYWLRQGDFSKGNRKVAFENNQNECNNDDLSGNEMNQCINQENDYDPIDDILFQICKEYSQDKTPNNKAAVPLQDLKITRIGNAQEELSIKKKQTDDLLNIKEIDINSQQLGKKSPFNPFSKKSETKVRDSLDQIQKVMMPNKQQDPIKRSIKKDEVINAKTGEVISKEPLQTQNSSNKLKRVQIDQQQMLSNKETKQQQQPTIVQYFIKQQK